METVTKIQSTKSKLAVLVAFYALLQKIAIVTEEILFVNKEALIIICYYYSYYYNLL